MPAIKATLNNTYFVFIAISRGRPSNLLVSKWSHQYLFKRGFMLSSTSLQGTPETRKWKILLLTVSLPITALLTRNFCFIILKINEIQNYQDVAIGIF